MKAPVLCFLTGLVTGLHNFYLLMDIVNGAPIYPVNCVALLGAGTLLGAAVLAPFRPRIAAKVCLAGSFLLWVFYAPLIIEGFIMPHTAWYEIQFFVSFREYVPLVGMLVGPILLIACTVNSILFFRHHQKSGMAMSG